VKGVETIPGKPFFYSTAMNLGGESMGLLVEVNDGRPTKIRQSEHPWSLARAKSFHQASILSLDPDPRPLPPREGANNSTWEALTAMRRRNSTRPN